MICTLRCSLSLCPRLSFSQLTRLTQVCKSWRQELGARGFCWKTVQLCSTIAGGGDAESLQQNAQRRLDASSGDDIERALLLDGGAFLEKLEDGGESEIWEGNSMQHWLQAASQEPDESILSRGAASTARSLGLALVRWIAKPQERYPGSYKLPGHTKFSNVQFVALSRDGKHAVSGSAPDNLVKFWNTETGAEVSSRE